MSQSLPPAADPLPSIVFDVGLFAAKRRLGGWCLLAPDWEQLKAHKALSNAPLI